MSKNIIKKGLIPAAGLGTRLFPATKVLKKEFFPIIDQNGRAKPVILVIVEELLSAGLEEIGIIIQRRDLEIFETFFQTWPPPELYNKLSLENQNYCQHLQEIGQKITFLFQDRQEGYGHAVFCAADWIGDEPFFLALGDHIYRSHTEISCAKQLVQIYEKVQKSVVGLTPMPAEIIHKAGIVTGNWLGYRTSSALSDNTILPQEKNSILSISRIWEKPTLKEAMQYLQIDWGTERVLDGGTEQLFLGIFGLYILTSKIFDYLEQDIQNNRRYRGEFQLTTGLENLCLNDNLLGYVVKGQYFDIGMPEFYRQSLWQFNQY